MMRETAQDDSLSFEAVGLLAYLLSKPTGWTAEISDIEKRGNIGREKRIRIVAELERAGYFERNRLRLPTGHFDYELIVHEQPLPTSQRTSVSNLRGAVALELEPAEITPQSENPYAVEPCAAQPHTENPSTAFLIINIHETEREVEATATTAGEGEPASDNEPTVIGREQESDQAKADNQPAVVVIFEAVTERRLAIREQEYLASQVPDSEAKQFEGFLRGWCAQYGNKVLYKIVKAYEDYKRNNRDRVILLGDTSDYRAIIKRAYGRDAAAVAAVTTQSQRLPVSLATGAGRSNYRIVGEPAYDGSLPYSGMAPTLSDSARNPASPFFQPPADSGRSAVLLAEASGGYGVELPF